MPPVVALIIVLAVIGLHIPVAMFVGARRDKVSPFSREFWGN